MVITDGKERPQRKAVRNSLASGNLSGYKRKKKEIKRTSKCVLCVGRRT